jgi:hypothetical protein
MKNTKVHIQDLHDDHAMWINELGFFNQQLDFFKRRLEEVVQRYTNNDILKEVEFFQNQFIIQKEVLQTLMHHFKVEEQKLSNLAIQHPVAIDRVLFEDHPTERDKMKQFVTIYQDLRDKYLLFLERYM